MRRIMLFCFVAAMFGVSGLVRAQHDFGVFGTEDIAVDFPDFVVAGVPVTASFTIVDDSLLAEYGNTPLYTMVNGERIILEFSQGKATTEVTFDRPEPFSVKLEGFAYVKEVNPMPLWLSVLPPLVAIVLALVFREVLLALFAGIFFGASVVGFYSNGFSGMAGGLFRVIDTYIINALNDWGHLAVILFSLFIGAIVAVVSKNGGMMGVVNRISKYATSPRSGQLTAWGMGIAIFFDDYANTLVVGNTLRPVTDRLRISREKLSYIVDSTAAPVAAIAFVTTWIGAQLGYIDDGIAMINEGGSKMEMGSYAVMVNSLSYSFYPILTLVFIFMLVWMKRDFGPMLRAERSARSQSRTIENQSSENQNHELKALEPAEGAPQKAYNAIIPIGVVIFGTIAGLLVTGWSAETWTDDELSFFRKLSVIIGQSDSYTALLWSSLSGLLVAFALSLGQKLLSAADLIETAFNGFKTMLGAVAILVLAWSLAAITEQMHSAEFLTSIIDGKVAYWLIPALTFTLAALVAFSTGTSWGTMAILYPLMLPLAWTVCETAGCSPEVTQHIFFHVVSAVLAGSVLGDHCSPISDTTILSSMACSVNHIAHVNTQLPYALTVGAVAITLSIVSAAFDLNGLLMMIFGIGILYGFIRLVGKTV
jgi:Na+/H+ antiporter NhaC